MKTVTSQPQDPATHETTKRKAPVSGFNRRAEKLEQKGYIVLHTNAHVLRNDVRKSISASLSKSFGVKEEEVRFLGNGTTKMMVTSWAVPCSDTQRRIAMPAGNLTIVACNGECFSLSPTRASAPPNSLVVILSGSLQRETIEAAVRCVPGAQGSDWSIRRKKEEGNWIVDGLSNNTKQYLLKEGLVIPLDGVVKHFAVVDPAQKPQGPACNDAAKTTFSTHVEKPPTVSGRSMSSQKVKNSVLKDRIKELEERVAKLEAEFTVASNLQHSLEQLASAVSVLVPLTGSITTLPNTPGTPPITAPPTVAEQQPRAPSKEDARKAIRLPTTEQVFVPTRTPGTDPLPREVPVLAEKPTSVPVPRATLQATNHTVAQPSKPLSFQSVMIVRHKDLKNKGRQYLIQENATGVKLWKDAAAVHSDVADLYEQALPLQDRRQVKTPSPAKADTNRRVNVSRHINN